MSDATAPLHRTFMTSPRPSRRTFFALPLFVAGWPTLAAKPAVITMLAMPLTFSIAEGIAIGFVVHVFFMLGIGRGKEVKPLSWGLGLLFLAHLIWR